MSEDEDRIDIAEGVVIRITGPDTIEIHPVGLDGAEALGLIRLAYDRIMLPAEGARN